MGEQSCVEFAPRAPELALGVLTGTQWARSIAHVDSCPGCRDLLRRYMDVGDELLQLVPPADPPAGFEQRTMCRIGLPDQQGRFRRRLAVAITAVVIAITGGIGGVAIGNAMHDQPAAMPQTGPAVRQAELRADQHRVGTVYVYTGWPSWLYMSIEVPAGTDRVSCLLRKRDGTEVTVGSFPVSGDENYWGAPSPVDPATLVEARVVDPQGQPLATATFAD